MDAIQYTTGMFRMSSMLPSAAGIAYWERPGTHHRGGSTNTPAGSSAVAYSSSPPRFSQQHERPERKLKPPRPRDTGTHLTPQPMAAANHTRFKINAELPPGRGKTTKSRGTSTGSQPRLEKEKKDLSSSGNFNRDKTRAQKNRNGRG